MTRMTILIAVGAASLAAVPAMAQTPYPYPQQGYPAPSYPPQAYPPGQYYPPQGQYPPGQGGIGQIINQLLGNNYNRDDRYAVERCASAAMVEASRRYRPDPYRQGYGNQGYYPPQMRVTAITEVRRRNNGVRVSGLLDSRGGYGQPYGNAYGYQGQGYQDPRYAAQGDLSFRCNVDYRGAVTNVRIDRNRGAYRGY